MNISQLSRLSESEAREFLETIRWPDGPTCIKCGSVNAYKLGGKAGEKGQIKCRDCKSKFTVRTDTIFEESPIPLQNWVYAFASMCASKKGISAHQLHRELGITYKTAWFMCHRIREAMNGTITILGGKGKPVEVDETYWGNVGKQKQGARGWDHKMKVLSLVEREGNKRSFHVPKVTAKTLRPILREQIKRDSHLMTDEARVYGEIGRDSFDKHSTVNHSIKEYVREDVSTNTVESSFALLKRGLYGTFHHVSERHLQRYVTEFDFRWNHRKVTDVERTVAVIRSAVGKRLTYKQPRS